MTGLSSRVSQNYFRNWGQAESSPKGATSPSKKIDPLSSAIDSINHEISQGKKIQYRFRPSAFCCGEAGMMGSCLGATLHIPNLIEKHKTLPQFRKPNESFNHSQKLLVLAVVKALGNEKIEPKKLTRESPYQLHIQKIVSEYQKLQDRRHGLSLKNSFPGPNFSDAAPMELVLKEIERKASNKDNISDNHFMLVINEKGKPFFEWHALYIDPVNGVIGDAALTIFWKIDEKDKHLFPQVLRKFMEVYYPNYSEGSLIQLEKKKSRCNMPLFMDRLLRRIETTIAIAKNNGFKAAFAYQCDLHRHNPLFEKFLKVLPLGVKKNIYIRYFIIKTAIDTYYPISREGISEKFLGWAKSNLAALSLFSPKQRSIIIDSLVAWYEKNPPKDLQETEVILEKLEQLENLGPKAHNFSSELQQKILCKLDLPFFLA